ncbi:hypothetical protein C0Q70_13853 [Pomacea canaliculata]|uniref:acylphosphatase n=1 Tax=Pomacea canaliculata TaxID=400727 RepID=A0A2T7NYF4_POMCA|nr:acylphosphatase-1-like [Pomacea canaliculata]PVD26184.1 hypothetical protein C0Q70_13853 [Pomacea canaliculata]
MAAAKPLLSVDFEVFGKVQGVFFRKHTQETARKLGLVGWVENTQNKTVIGQVQGQQEKVAEMKKWLKTKGSPKSKITKCDFKNEKTVSTLAFKVFEIKK